jgi:hypothetical protein
MTRTALTRLAVGTIVLMVSATACHRHAGTAAQDRAYAIETLTARANGELRLRLYDTIDELLPNVSYRQAAGSARPLADGVILGRIVETTPGQGFVNGDRRSMPVPFDDERADWKTLHLVVEVTDTIGGPTLDRVRMGLAVGARTNMDALGDGLRSLGRVLLFLQHRPNAVFDYDAGLYTDVEGGALLATVDDAGRIRLPMKSRAEEAVLLGSVRTVADLEAAATRPARTVQLDDLGERVG